MGKLLSLLCLLGSYALLVLIIVLLIIQVGNDSQACNDFFKPKLDSCYRSCGLVSNVNVSGWFVDDFEPVVVGS